MKVNVEKTHQGAILILKTLENKHNNHIFQKIKAINLIVKLKYMYEPKL